VWEDICTDYIIHFMFDDLVKSCARYFRISHFRSFDYELGFRINLFEVVSGNDIIGMVNVATKSNNEVHLYYEHDVDDPIIDDSVPTTLLTQDDNMFIFYY